MIAYSHPQVIELFHVAFLDALSRRLAPGRYVLKGGANLRYFCDSVRYSEDIDLDITGAGVEKWQLEKKVDEVLEGRALPLLLRASGLSVAEFTKPKQTETTQRWKVAVAVAGRDDPIRTKIEFSRRNGDTRYELDAIPSRIVQPYALRSPSVQHYIDDAPTEQKVEALAKRTETQARDVFDLDLLLRKGPLRSGAPPRETLEAAAHRALELPYAAYRDQVLPFLEEDALDLYGNEEAWEQIQTFVAENLEGAK